MTTELERFVQEMGDLLVEREDVKDRMKELMAEIKAAGLNSTAVRKTAKRKIETAQEAASRRQQERKSAKDRDDTAEYCRLCGLSDEAPASEAEPRVRRAA